MCYRGVVHGRRVVRQCRAMMDHTLLFNMSLLVREGGCETIVQAEAFSYIWPPNKDGSRLGSARCGSSQSIVMTFLSAVTALPSGTVKCLALLAVLVNRMDVRFSPYQVFGLIAGGIQLLKYIGIY